MDEAACKEEMRPVKQQLRRLKTGTDDLPREEKLAVLKECLSIIGRRIDIVVDDKRHAGMNADKWRKHLWVFATFFWPREGVSYQKLQAIHAKMINASGQVAPPPRKSAAGSGSTSRKKAVKQESQSSHHPLKKIKLTHRAGEHTDDQMEE
ncbi:hypothetical protein QFC19_003717 [Naganishia cerealis]|uniref:Uncharacterized protein n=1 Tax=Naganishia cerealis TaxID=610337 RepID=A0ACC2W1F1_9TREE|nr:hypothetical protein QFC19_003717 [Naganishia cerealis]